jgi:hypothetical protein
MTVSRTRKNFSASMCVAPLTIASLVLLRLAGFKFNHLSESAACRALLRCIGSLASGGSGTGLDRFCRWRILMQ